MTTETATQNQTDASTAFLRAARAGQLDKILSLLNQDVDINVSNANGLNAMHLASKDGHSEVVSTLLQRGAHIDAATKKGNTALHIAALAGQEAVVKLLVQSNAQVNIQSQNGFTPLYMAAQENHDGVVKFLLANGANQSLATEDGFTPLAVAMQQGHEKVVAVLLEADTGRVRLPALHIAAKKDDCKAATLLLENDHNPDVTSKSGFTPLHIAAHYGNEAVAKLLLAKGADVNCAAKHNICPLHVAAKWGKANMVALLAENGAQVEARTRDGLTPLHCAARSGHEHVVDMLLERGAPISGKSKNGLAPLHMAAQGDHSDAARILLYHRAPVDDLTVDYLTALHVAAHCGHVKVAKLLLDRNADANARALNGFTPLHIACKKNRIKVVELLLKYGASISATTESGLTPLHVAAFMGCMNIVIYLLQHEASPDVPTVRGETPLHLAARANQTDIIRILLRNGAAVDARAREMQTALHIASRLGNVDIVLLLVQHGAQLDALTADNYNSLHIAAKQHNHEVAAVLLEHGAPPNAVTKKGFTPLHLAAKYGNLKVANLLLQQRGELDARGKNGVTPLHVAAQYRHHAVATALLEKGADPKAAAKNGHTALHIAARKNQMETAAALMERGAIVDAESKAGCTPLHLAAHQGHADMCSLLMEQGADAGRKAKSGLAALHLAAQEDHVPVAKMLVNNGAKVDVCTKGGYTPLHVASHFGQTNMVKFLLESGANVQANTCHGYTALHHAAQQGHINIVNLLLEHKADANATTNNGQTPLDIAQRLGYVTVMDTLKGVSEPSPVSQPKDDKYRPVAPETMYETFMSDSEEEGGEDTMLTDQPYRYLTVDDMKSLGDDSLPIDVTRDERAESTVGLKTIMDVSQGSTASNPPYVVDELSTAKAVNHLYNAEVMKEGYCYNVDATQPKRKLQWKNFLVSFLVDARGGAMRGCRGSGVRVIVPPLSAQQPTRITCRYVRAQRVSHMPPLMEGEALASRVLELGPVSAKFIGPIILEVPHYASLRGKEREIVILRSDNGTTWREHALEAADCAVQDILNDTLEIEEPPEEQGAPPSRMTRILTHDFPQYFAVISRIRQEVHAIGPEGGMVSSSVVPQVQAVFPQGALTKKIKVGLQAQTIEAELTAKLLGRGVAVSPVVTVEPRRRKFHKAITLSMPAPRPHSQGMINQYTTSAPTLRLLCSISGGTNRAHWEDVTDSTPLTFVNDCVSFTTTVSARYWLMDCRNVTEATKMATELYREAIHVPFMAKFVVYAKRTEHLQAQLRVFCVTDDREDKTLERMERFSQVAKSRDVEVHEGKPVYLEFGGNFSPVAKSGEQPKLEFRAFRESRLQLGAMVRGAHADAVARCQFMSEPRRPKGEPVQPPICVLNIVLPEEVVPMDLTLPPYQSKLTPSMEEKAEVRVHATSEESEIKWPERLTDARIASMCDLLGMDWVPLAYELGVSSAVVASIREKGNNGAQQAMLMLSHWKEQGGLKAHDNQLELALCRIGREDVLLPQSTAEAERRIQRNIYQERQSSEEIMGYKSPDSEIIEKERIERTILEQEDNIKAFDKEDIDRLERDLRRQTRDKPAVDDLVGERDESKYSPEEKSYVGETEGSDREPSFTPSEESEEEEGIKKSVAERKIQITRKLSTSKVPASKQKKELKEEIIEIKKQINPEIKKFHQQSSITKMSQESSKDSLSKLSKKSSTDEEDIRKHSPIISPQEQVEHSPKEKVLPKFTGPRHMQKHVRNESMIRFSSGDFSDVKVPQKGVEEKITETKVTEETVIKSGSPIMKTEIKKETVTIIGGSTRTITTEEEIMTIEKDIAELPLKQKISSFESKMLEEKTKAETDKFESKVKLTEEALKKHTEGQKTAIEYTEDFIKDQMRSQEEIVTSKYQSKVEKKDVKQDEADPGSPDLVSDFAAELMKAEETFRASADHMSEKYTDNYFKGQTLAKTFAKTSRTDSTIVQFSSEEDSEFLKKSTDSETETESQITAVKNQFGLFEGDGDRSSVFKGEALTKPKGKIPGESVRSPKLMINIERDITEESSEDLLSSSSKDIKPLEHDVIKTLKGTEVDRLRVDSLEDSLQISSDEDAQIQPTDDESESQVKEITDEIADVLVKQVETKQVSIESSKAELQQQASQFHARSDSMGSDFSKRSAVSASISEGAVALGKPTSRDSPQPPSVVDKTDSLADSVSYISQSESKVYSKESRPTRSDSLDEASQFSDMEETQIGAPLYGAAAIGVLGAAAAVSSMKTPAPGTCLRTETMKFLEQESIFSSSELGDKKVKEKVSSSQEEPVISAKARQFIETVPEDDTSGQDCFFSKRIYSDSLEESEQYGTDNDSRRPSEADSFKSDKSEHEPEFKMAKISSEIEEGIDENIDSSLIDDVKLDSEKTDAKFELMKTKKDSSEDKDSSKGEKSDSTQDEVFKKVTKRHSRNESVSITKFSSIEMKDADIARGIVAPEVPKRATEFQMFVTEAIDDERVSSFEREELSDRISSESSREIEVSDKKWSDGVSDKISSEDGVTDKISSDSAAQIDDTEFKASSGTIHAAEVQSPDLVMDDDDEKADEHVVVKSIKKDATALEKIESKLMGLKETTMKLDDTLSKGLKRASLGSSSAGEGSLEILGARGGKRESDAPSLTDSRDYTFEESEDSIPVKGGHPKHEAENKAKAILEPIYDKALRAVRGDSLDDVEPFCMDQEGESPRLPGISETHQLSGETIDVEVHQVFEKVTDATVLATALKGINVTTTKETTSIQSQKPKSRTISLTQGLSKDEGKDYSVHSSPDEVEEKICTDTESDTDQAKVLEIIEPTSEGDIEFVPSFDTSKIKQDSLDDADDFFPEKEMGFSDMQKITSIEKAPSTEMETVTTTKVTESKIFTTEDSEKQESEEEENDLLDSKVDISSTISSIGATVAASIGIELKAEDVPHFSLQSGEKEEHPGLRRMTSKDSLSRMDFHTSELVTDTSSVLAGSAGIDLDSNEKIESRILPHLKSTDSKDSFTSHDLHTSELISDMSATLAASMGIDFKPEDESLRQSKESLHKEHQSLSKLGSIDSKHEHPISELISDASATLAASVGVDFKYDDDSLTYSNESLAKDHPGLMKTASKDSIIKHEHPISELLADASSTLAAAIGVDYKPDDDAISHHSLKSSGSRESLMKHEFHISELVTDASSTLAASVGVDFKPDHDEMRRKSLKSSSSKESLVKHDFHASELVTDASSTLAASAGLHFKPDEDTISHHSLKSSSSKEDLAKHASELVVDTSETLAASVGIELKPEEHHEKKERSGSFAKHHVDILESITEVGATAAESIGIDMHPDRSHQFSLSTSSSKDEEAHDLVQEKVAESGDAAIGVALKFGKEHYISLESADLEKFEEDKKLEEDAQRIMDEMKRSEGPDSSDNQGLDSEQIVSEMKDLNRSNRRCSDFLEGISQPGGSQIRIDTSQVTHGLSLKFSKTPPPSPVDLIQREKAAGSAVFVDQSGHTIKGSEGSSEASASKLSPRDSRLLKDGLPGDQESLQTDSILPPAKTLSSSSSPKSPTRHHADNISFVNVEAITMHPEVKTKIPKKYVDTDPKILSPDEDIESMESLMSKFESKKDATSEGESKPDDAKVSPDNAEKVEAQIESEVESSEAKENVETKFESKEELSPASQIRMSEIEKSFEESRKTFKEETRQKFQEMKKDFEESAIAKFAQMKEDFAAGKDLSKKSPEDGSGRSIVTKIESVTHQTSGQEFFSEKQQILVSGDDVVAEKIETKKGVVGEEYVLKEKEVSETIGDVTHTARSSIEKEQKASAERHDSEARMTKKGEDDSAVIVVEKEFAETGLYSGRQSKSEEKMTAIKDEVSKKTEISYSERDLSHEQWGKEYFAERTELEPTEEVDSETSQSKDVYMESNVKVIEKDEKITTEEKIQGDKVVKSVTGYNKEESVVESKEHSEMSPDVSRETSLRSDLLDKSEMSPKSRSKSLKKEEVYEVDFIKEIKVSTSQRDKSISQGGSLDTQSESDLTGDLEVVAQTHQDLLPDDDLPKSKDGDKKSPVHKPEEHVQQHVWEVSVQKQESLDEFAADLQQSQSKYLRDEPRSWDVEFASQSESKSSMSGSDVGIATISSDRDVKIKLNGLSLASSEETHDVEPASEDFESFKDSMMRSGESVETEYMIKSIDSQDTDTLQKSMDSTIAETMQQSEKEDYSLEADSFVADLQRKKDGHKLVKEKSLEDICSSGYDTDLSSAEFLASKLELERADIENVRAQPLAKLSDVEKTIDEVKQSLEAAHGEIISEKHDSSIKYKQSPSEFEFKLISPDRPEVIHEEPPQQPESILWTEREMTDSKPTSTSYEQQTSISSKALEDKFEVKETSDRVGGFEMTMKDTQGSQKDSDSSSKHDETFTSDDDRETALEKEKQLTQDVSEFSTGLESGPISLLDTETEMVSDREESPKGSPGGVRLRPVQKHIKSSHMIVTDRRSASDMEGWSSSGESHYQSFEHTDSPHSRPLSSDVENILTAPGDYHSALTTQDASSKSQRTSKEYYTAVSSLSSRDSMKSLDSESSGHLASVDISDASETLVPSATDLKDEMMESGSFSEQFDTEYTKIKDSIIKEVAEDLDEIEDMEAAQIKMIESLEVLGHPVGLSDHSEEGSLDDEIVHEAGNEVVSKMKRSHEMSFQPKELLPEKVPTESLSESIDLDADIAPPESDSQIFRMSKIETGPSSVKHIIKETTAISHKSPSKSLESSKSYATSEKVVEYHTSSVVYKTPDKKPKKEEDVETIVERKVTTVKVEPRPRTTTTTVEQRTEIDIDALVKDIIPKGSSEYQEIVSTHSRTFQSGTTVSGSSSFEQKASEPYEIDSKQSSSSSLKIQDEYLSTPHTPLSNPSQSSESTDNGREYVLDEMYEISEDPELFHSERAMTDSKSELSVTQEERTLYEVQKDPDSPISDEFEMVDKPNEMDDFVVIEEVAKEASEFDAEGKSVNIARVTYTKKHDEEIEEYLSKTSKKPSSETEYSTSGSLSEEEILQYELEQKKIRAAETAEIEAGKKWIQMQFEGDLAAARYDYERGPLEDIKEEEMADFDASRIGSLSSQKESVGSYGSMKNSYGSLSESEMMLRRRYMMRTGDNDDVSVSSLQEFESLEQAMSMEGYHHSSSSQDSLNGSLSKRYHANRSGADDVSVSSLKEFEGLESACLEALRIEIDAKQKEALLLAQDGRNSSAGFLDMEKRSYSHGSSESSPPQKSGSPSQKSGSPGQKSGSPSQKSGSPGQKSGSPGQKSGSPGQKYGSPSQKALADSIAIRKLIDQQMADGDDKTSTIVTDSGATVTYAPVQKMSFDNRGAFYVPDTQSSTECSEGVCMKKSTYECKTGDGEKIGEICETQQLKDLESDLGSSFTEADANMIGVITTTKVIQQRFVDGQKVSEYVTTTSSGKGVDIPGAAHEEKGEYGSGTFQEIDVGSGKSIPDYGSEFSSSITSQQSDTESLVTMMEQHEGSDLGSGPGSLETISVSKKVVVASRQMELDLGCKSGETSDSGMRETSPMSGKSGSGFSAVTSKTFTDPASGSWSGLDEDMSSSGSFSRTGMAGLPRPHSSRNKEEDLMLGSTDSLEQTSSNATRATYNYEVDTPMTGSLTSAGSNTMVSSLETLEPVTAFYEKAEKTLGRSTEDCFTMEYSGSEHLEYEVQEPDSDNEKQGKGKPQIRERTIRFGSEGSSEDTTLSGKSGQPTFFIGDTPITKEHAAEASSSSTTESSPPVPAQRKSLTGMAKPFVYDPSKQQDDDTENV